MTTGYYTENTENLLYTLDLTGMEDRKFAKYIRW